MCRCWNCPDLPKAGRILQKLTEIKSQMKVAPDPWVPIIVAAKDPGPQYCSCHIETSGDRLAAIVGGEAAYHWQRANADDATEEDYQAFQEYLKKRYPELS